MFRQNVRFPMGTICATLFADMFVVCFVVREDSCCLFLKIINLMLLKTVSEHDQEILQSHTADQTRASRGRATEH